MYVIGEDDRAPTPQELVQMQDLVRAAMREDALGVGSSLIYAPAFFAGTDELIALARAAAEFGGGYISHMRSESRALLDALEELITIGREAGGEANWPQFPLAIARIERERATASRNECNTWTPA